MKIGIVGSRSRDKTEDYAKVLNKFDELRTDEPTTIISGGCPIGADEFAETISMRYGLPIIIHHADWNKHGNKAGFIRNTLIAFDSDILIACVSKCRTGGTEDTIRKFKLDKGDKNLYIV